MIKSKNFLLILFVAALAPACNNQNDSEETIVKDYYKNGQLKSKVAYNSNMRKEGVYLEYYESGEKKIECNFLNGFQNGIAKKYHKNGRIWFTSEWEGGVMIGERIQYDSVGRTVCHIIENRSGIRILSSDSKNEDVEMPDEIIIINSMDDIFPIVKYLDGGISIQKDSSVIAIKYANIPPYRIDATTAKGGALRYYGGALAKNPYEYRYYKVYLDAGSKEIIIQNTLKYNGKQYLLKEIRLDIEDYGNHS